MHLPASGKSRQNRISGGKFFCLMAISITWYYVCVCMLYRCSVHCEYHHYLSLFTALVPVLQDLHFRLEDIYPYCKPIVVFGIIVGSSAEKGNGSTYIGISNQLICLSLVLLLNFLRVGGCERRALFSVCHFLFLPLKAGTHSNTCIALTPFLKRNLI